MNVDSDNMYPYEQHPSHERRLFFSNSKKKYYFLATEPRKNIPCDSHLDLLQIAEDTKNNIINKQIYDVFLLYSKVLEEKKKKSKTHQSRKEINKKVDHAIREALELYLLLVNKQEHNQRKYLKKICLLCEDLFELLIKNSKRKKTSKIGESTSSTNNDNTITSYQLTDSKTKSEISNYTFLKKDNEIVNININKV
ncbi:conserved protein, unknown function [Hepatocystis sp. ex Piliocolobus tephrosceles]|nr:conserved protein, unknown function [Hepatocystis sp. ex Piliocolobus tephrosceles]